MCETCNSFINLYNNKAQKEAHLYIMKKLLLLIPVGLLFFCMSISGQVNTDSLSLISEISRDQLKLGKLQNQLKQQINDKKDASDKAQYSANENSTAADKLSDNPDNKKLARKAKNRAGDAKRDSRNARSESENLDKLNKDIQDLENRIAKNEDKLYRHIRNGMNRRTAADTIPN